MTIFFATGLSDSDDAEGDEEDLEIVPIPLTDLDETIAEVDDSKSLIALLLLKQGGQTL